MRNKILVTFALLFGFISSATAGQLTGIDTLYAGTKVVEISADKEVIMRCSIDEKLLGNAVIAELKRSRIKFTEKWNDKAGLVSLSVVAINLENSRLCVIGMRIQLFVLANIIQNKVADKVVELYGSGGIHTYGEQKGSTNIVQAAKDYAKSLADQIIVDN